MDAWLPAAERRRTDLRPHVPAAGGDARHPPPRVGPTRGVGERPHLRGRHRHIGLDGTRDLGQGPRGRRLVLRRPRRDTCPCGVLRRGRLRRRLAGARRDRRTGQGPGPRWHSAPARRRPARTQRRLPRHRPHPRHHRRRLPGCGSAVITSSSSPTANACPSARRARSSGCASPSQPTPESGEGVDFEGAGSSIRPPAGTAAPGAKPDSDPPVRATVQSAIRRRAKAAPAAIAASGFTPLGATAVTGRARGTEPVTMGA